MFIISEESRTPTTWILPSLAENDPILPYNSGKRKPDPNFYLEALSHLKVDAANCIFIDDRLYSFHFSMLDHFFNGII